MPLYGGMDLHANNRVVVFSNEQAQIRYQKRGPNDLATIVEQGAPHHPAIEGLVGESTYNWYWLVDGGMDAGYRLPLAHPAAIPQYRGLKYTNDHSEARWLAHMLRLGVLPAGYISPKAQRPVRDGLRQRKYLVEQQSSHGLRVQNIILRHTGARLSANRLKPRSRADVETLVPAGDQALSVSSSLAVATCLAEQITSVDKRVQSQLRSPSLYKLLQTVSGIGPIVAQTILLETGDSRRVPRGGD